jgi:hypothetical protein
VLAMLRNKKLENPPLERLRTIWRTRSAVSRSWLAISP